MNKKIKRIISLTLAIGTFSVIAPASNLDLFATKAYAYNTSDDVAFLKDIDVNHGSLNFSKTRTSYDIKLNSDVETIDITANPDKSTYDVTIDGEKKTGQWTKTIKLDKGRNKITIKSEDSGENGPITYYVNVYRGGTSKSSSDDDEVYIDNITLSDGDISFSRTKKSYDINVAQSVSEIRIKADPDDVDDDVVTINGVTVDGEDKYRKTVALSSGKNVVTIVVEDNDGENGNKETYTLNIYRGGSVATTTTTGEIDDNQDSIYLDDIVIEDGTVPISFRPRVTSYAVDVKKDWENVIIKAVPQDDDRIVRVNGNKLSYDGKFRTQLALKEGKNVFEVKVTNEDEYDSKDDSSDAVKYKQRTYTLTVYRGTSQGTAAGITSTNTANNNTNVNANIKVSQWVSNNGKWQYNDALGNSLKNMWFLDKSTSYWYYLDANGDMKTGWIQDGSGNYYYLYPNGSMASNTTIGAYKLGSNGAWSK